MMLKACYNLLQSKIIPLKAALALLIMCLSANVSFANFAYVPNPGDHTVSVIDTNTNVVVATIHSVSTNGLSSAVATPDGKFVYVSGANIVSVIDIASNTVTATIPVAAPTAISVAPSGEFVYVISNANAVAIIDTQTNMLDGSPISIIGAANLLKMAVTPNGNFIYMTDPNTDKVFVLNIQTQAVSSILLAGSEPQGIAITPDGLLALVANAANDVSVIQTSDNSIINTIHNVNTSAIEIETSPVGSSAYVTTDDGNLYTINTLTYALSSPIAVGVEPFSLAVLSNGLFVYIVNLGSNNVSVFNTSTNTLLPSPIPVGRFPSSIAITPDLPPQGIAAEQKQNDFGVEYELFNSLEWGASPNSSIVGYNVYRNGKKIATVGSTTLQYQDHNIKKGVTTVYSVTAFNAGGLETRPVTISVQ